MATSLLTMVGCGSGAGSGTFTGGEDGGAPYDATSTGNLFGDATVSSDGSPTCTPRTCALAGKNCGPIADGCGNAVDCGSCTAPQTCGGGGTPSVCGGTAACVPATCATLAVNCGQQGDGCGNIIDCGSCTAPETCGGGSDAGGGTPSVCGGSAGCVPLKACPAGIDCGSVGDGCGGLVDCSGGVACPPGTTCGGGGTPSVCGAANQLPDGGFLDGGLNLCTPVAQAKACANINCGIASDGCGSAYTCGSCTAPQTCGGGGTPSVCGGNSGCVPAPACPSGMNCGAVADGCGGLVYCGSDAGTCPATELCGGGGQPNVCGAKNVLPDGAIIDGGLNVCTPIAKVTACAGHDCGLASDGCGNTYGCGTCTAPATCGGGGTPSICGGNSGCVPRVSCAAGMNCGVVADGCGGTVSCSHDGGTCPPNELCGGGGQPNVCGAKNILPDGGIIDGGLNLCTAIPQATACAGIGCGQTGDGCGNLYTCGTCTGQNTCGGGGVAFQCGQPACTPLTTCPFGVNCGTIGNGCGGTLNCGSCAAPATCGGGGVSSQCGLPSCVPATKCPAGVNCGPWPDGCGGAIASCGTCTSPDTCGGNGTSSQCGHPACVPITKCPAPANCGTWPDGCGGSISCGGCTFPQICGGSGVPSVCGGGLSDGGAACSGVSCFLQSCSSGTLTSISGHVFDPAGNNPLYNVVVYVPQSRPAAFTHGPSCDACGSLYTGNPLVATTTDATGFFELVNVPVMANMPLVLQIGKWRRQMAIAQPLTPCTNNAISDTTLTDGGITRAFQLPSKEAAASNGDAGTGPWEGPGTIDDLPQIAISTGGADTLECLFQRVGVATAEYTPGAGGTGHLHVFQGSSNAGNAPKMATSPRSYTALWDSYTDLSPYDVVVLSCEGEETRGAGGNGLSKAETNNLYAYANAGGRVFASHFHYAWFNNNTGADGGSFGADNLATWHTGANAMTDQAGNAEVNTNVIQSTADGGPFVRGQALFSFLQNTKALGPAANLVGPADGTGTTELNIQSPKHNADVTAANTASQPWLVADSDASVPNATEYFSFDTPVGGEKTDAGLNYCGRVVFSDLHVGSAVKPADTSSATVPSGCSNTTLSPQEKALEFMLFDLSSCVSSDSNLPIPPSCTPLKACPANITCGTYPNGCGTGNLTCGTCAGSCVDGQCIACTAQTKCPNGVTCGEYPDGCGGILQCGTCASGECINGTCATGCKPQTCASQGITCGQAGDGCGGTLPGVCGTCNPGQSCINGACVSAPCNKVSCQTLGLACGKAGDGCGGTQDCGDCTVAGQTCGGGGTPGVCGEGDANACTPLTCGGQGIQCGPAGDGCGNLIASCGACPTGQACGGGGTPGVCGAPNCTPLGCGSLKCGATGDGCGGVISCGTCAAPLSCGGGGTPGVCGQGDANACKPLTCGSITCGETGDGCGNVIDCGACTPPQTCGGGGTPGVCGAPSCTPIGCGSLKCGPSGDGCGGTLNCGVCTAPETCGGGGTVGVCGQGDANACTPLGCGSVSCGKTGDGCGNLIDCGTCTPPLTCGGGGVPGACGAPTCTPKTCTQLGATCGQVADGCGGLTSSCGTCTGGATCGGGGTPNQCGSPNCTPTTCALAGANCGPVADGCGGIIQCGDCTSPATCGGGGIASQCGTATSK